MNDGDPVVERTTFRGSPVRVLTPSAVLRDVAFAGAGPAISASPTGAGAVFESVATTTGAPVVLEVASGSVQGEVVWGPGVTYAPAFDVRVPAGASLTLAPGVVFKGQTTYNSYQTFASRFVVDGVLHAVGTPAEPVVLTTRNDSSVGADASVPLDAYANGDSWEGITANDASDVVLEHVRAAGSRTLLAAGQGSRVRMRSVAALDGGSGLPAVSSSSDDLVIEGSRFEGAGDFDRVGVSVRGASQILRTRFVRSSVTTYSPMVVLHGNVFADLTGVMLRNVAAGTVDAELNWWGSETGPVLAGSERDIDGDVDADPRAAPRPARAPEHPEQLP